MFDLKRKKALFKRIIKRYCSQVLWNTRKRRRGNDYATI